MPSKRPFRVTRDVPGGINPGSFGRKVRLGASSAGWAARRGSSGRGAKEVLVKISGGGRDADGMQAHFEYIDRHGKLDIETDHGEVLQGKTAATELINDWALDYEAVPWGASLAKQSGCRWEAAPTPRSLQYCALDAGGHSAANGLQAMKKFARE